MKVLFSLFVGLVLLGFIGCSNEDSSGQATQRMVHSPTDTLEKTTNGNESTLEVMNSFIENSIDLDEKETTLADIQKMDPTLKIELRYATTNNFMGKILYNDIDRIYLQEEVALKLKKAQQFLKTIHPSWSLLIFDGARPLHIQQKMWDALDSIPPTRRARFLSNPANGGSIHNYGAAVDLTIIDGDGDELDMGTPYDDIRTLAYPRLEQQFLSKGELTQQQIDNRKLLRHVMTKAGFSTIPTEWWHFNSCTRAEAMRKYEVIK